MALGTDMWPLRVLFLLLSCSGLWCHDCNKTRVYFVSRNFFSVLNWHGVDIPGQEVLYSVQYKQYGEPRWSQIMGCQNISATSCDLSSVTTDEIYQRYYSRVLVNSDCVGKYEAFVPSEQTILGAPEVAVSISESSLTVTITTPMAPQNRLITEISKDRSGKPHITYEVHLTHPKSQTGKRTHNTSSLVTLSSLQVNTEYCGAAFYLWTHPSKVRKSENTTFCVTLPGKSWTHIFILPGLLAVFLLITLALILCQLYVMRKQHLPDMLKQRIPKIDTPLYHPDPKLKIDIVRIYLEPPGIFNEPVPHALPAVAEPKVVSNGSSYASQDWDGAPGICNSYANQNVAPVENYNASNQSATSYSMVVNSPVPKDPEESPDSPNSSGLGDSIGSHVLWPTSPCAGEPFQVLNPDQGLDEKDSDFINKPVVLQVSRHEGGKLELSFLQFQPELLSTQTLLSNSETKHLASEMPAAGERTPLLTDLIAADEMERTDSGFSSDYEGTPNYVQQNFTEKPCTDTIPVVSLPDFTSSYKQNWMPDTPEEFHLSGGDCVANADQLTEPEVKSKHMEYLFHSFELTVGL